MRSLAALSRPSLKAVAAFLKKALLIHVRIRDWYDEGNQRHVRLSSITNHQIERALLLILT